MTPIQISTMISIGSLALGLGAWVFGFLAITRARTNSLYSNMLCSFSLCAVALLLQLFEVQNRVDICDYAAIEDTIGAVNVAAAVLVIVTIALNIVALIKARKR